jgi:hypothetical protein
MIGNIIGISSKRRSGSIITSGLTAPLEAKFLFIWMGTYNGDNLKNILSGGDIVVTGKDFAGNYIPSTSVATFAIPNSASFINADTDSFWYSGAILQKTTAQLVATDPQRTILKYDNDSPYDIRWIGILKLGETLTSADRDELTTYCELWYLYFDEWNDLGYGKENRA